MSEIVVVGAKCERCGINDDQGKITDTYLMRNDGDRFATICKNAMECLERQERNRIARPA